MNPNHLLPTLLLTVTVAAWMSPTFGQELAPDPEAPPRYSFEVGQRLRYEYASEFRYKMGPNEGTQSGNGTWEVTALAQNADGSWTLLLVQTLKLTQRQGPDAYEQPPQVDLVQFDLFPDGRVRVPADPMGGLEPRALFPALPLGTEATWEDRSYDELHAYRELESEKPDSLIIEERFESLLHRATLKEVIHRFEFDRVTGRVSGLTSEIHAGYGLKGSGTVKVRLSGVETRPTTETLQLLRDAGSYTGLVSTLRSTLRAASYGAENWAKSLADARERLSKIVGEVQTPMIATKARQLANVYDQQVQSMPGRIEQRRQWIGTEGAAWDRMGFDGERRNHEQLRGKIAVLAFWNRGNVWGLRMLPRMKTLAQRYDGKPITFLSMNNDRVRADAEFVLDLVRLPFPTVECAGLAEQFGITAFPAVLVLTPDGKIHNLHQGYVPELIGDVESDIETLLSSEQGEKPKKPAKTND